MLEAHPGDECGAEHKIEKSFVGNSENDEDWRESQEDHDQAV